MSNPTGNQYIAAAQSAIAAAKKEEAMPLQTGSVLTDYKWPIIAGIVLIIFLILINWYTSAAPSKPGFKVGNAFGIVGEL